MRETGDGEAEQLAAHRGEHERTPPQFVSEKLLYYSAIKLPLFRIHSSYLHISIRTKKRYSESFTCTLLREREARVRCLESVLARAEFLFSRMNGRPTNRQTSTAYKGEHSI